ncbi:MAG TPA: hypothetical protein VG456_21610 [Candidatus Sulfopaludibacter sp.]|jgi:hypothetical protein|nr:hypothetical protein [Candidatus Sulfopaludibacter sp.]
MIQPWFDPDRYAWIPGTLFGSAAGILGALVAWLVVEGKARAAMIRSWIVLWIVAMALLVAGLIGLRNGQPYGVWYGLLLPGIVGTLVLGGNLVVIIKRYREIEQRRLAAKDLR